MSSSRLVVAAVAAAGLLSGPAARAQFSAVEWDFDSACGNGSLVDEVMHVTGCDGTGSLVDAFFHGEVPYAGTAFARVDFFNHDVFLGIDKTAWQVDGATQMLHHNFEQWIGSLVFEVPAPAVVGLGVASGDSSFGPAVEDLTEFHYFPAGVTQQHDGPELGADFGAAVAAAGDVDGDGVPDLLVGAPLANEGDGRVLLLSGLDGDVLLDLSGPSAGGAFGAAVSGAGDVDGDDVPDLLIGAPTDPSAGVDAGAAYLLSGTDGSPLLVLVGDAPFDHFGHSVAGLGDTDGDEVPDLAVGAPLNDAAGNKSGLVRVVSGADGSVLLELTGDADRDELGTLVARVGDADGDDRADLLLGTPLADAGGINRGEARLVSVESGALVQTWTGTTDNERFASSVAGPGDIDGDGLADVLIGSPDADSGQARLHAASDGNLLHAWDLTDWLDRGFYSGVGGPTSETRFADVVAAAGDVDADGVPDLLVRGMQRTYTSMFAEFPQAFVFVFSGRDGGLLDVFSGPPDDGRYGEALAAPGDLDLDGRDDVLIGHPAGAAGPGAVETVTTRVIWADLGFSLAGIAGSPRLEAFGLLAPGTPVGLSLSDAAPSAISFLVVGTSAVNLPFSGGVLVPTFAPPSGLLLMLPTTAGGGWNLSGDWPGGVPSGTSIWLQVWTADAAAPAGRSASNALRATVP